MHETETKSPDSALRDLLHNPGELERLAQEAVRDAIAEHLAAGYPVPYGGLGDDIGKLTMDTPDGRRFEFRVRPDGAREIIREVTR